jgi:hypothetical protein
LPLLLEVAVRAAVKNGSAMMAWPGCPLALGDHR